jgi:hypothetical protein
MGVDERVRSDDEMARIDVAALIRDGLGQRVGDKAVALRGDGAIAAAIAVDRLGGFPRSLTFLAEVVRRGGRAYAAELPEPLPTPELSTLAGGWLAAAAELPDSPEVDGTFARWLDAVAQLVELRRRTRGTSG